MSDFDQTKHVTVDEMRQMLEIVKGVQTQLDSINRMIEIVDNGLQKQINLIVGHLVKETKGNEIGLDGLHKMASGEEEKLGTVDYSDFGEN